MHREVSWGDDAPGIHYGLVLFAIKKAVDPAIRQNSRLQTAADSSAAPRSWRSLSCYIPLKHY
jgi:hypothetical protein